MTSFESTLVPPCLNSGVLMRMSQSTTKMVLDLLERITFSSGMTGTWYLSYLQNTAALLTTFLSAETGKPIL